VEQAVVLLIILTMEVEVEQEDLKLLIVNLLIQL
jgi:hypothetical protein